MPNTVCTPSGVRVSLNMRTPGARRKRNVTPGSNSTPASTLLFSSAATRLLPPPMATDTDIMWRKAIAHQQVIKKEMGR